MDILLIDTCAEESCKHRDVSTERRIEDRYQDL